MPFKDPRRGWLDVGLLADYETLLEVEVISVFADIASQLGGIPCEGHLDFAAGTFTYHRERECTQ